MNFNPCMHSRLSEFFGKVSNLRTLFDSENDWRMRCFFDFSKIYDITLLLIKQHLNVHLSFWFCNFFYLPGNRKCSNEDIEVNKS